MDDVKDAPPIDGSPTWENDALLPGGVLRSLTSLARRDPVRLRSFPVTFGRAPASTVQLSGEQSAPDHAILKLEDDEYILVDRCSAAGTYVNDVRITACRLTEGDIIRFSPADQFVFERRASAEACSAAADPCDLNQPSVDRATVTFWGTRGSIPVSRPAIQRYGGNTTCVEIRARNHRLILDAGTGIRELGEHLLKQPNQGQPPIALLMTHYHMDHVQGFPFFAPAFVAGQQLDVWGPQFDLKTLEEPFETIMRRAYFPVPLDRMGSNLKFHRSPSEWSVNGFEVKSLPLSHPGGVLAYRIAIDDQVFVFATDCEMSSPRQAHSGELEEFFAGADLLAIDCQFSDEQYETHRGQGHNSTSMAAAVANEFKPRALALIHHDPGASDAAVAANVDQVRARCRDDMPVFAARDGLSVAVAATS